MESARKLAAALPYVRSVQSTDGVLLIRTSVEYASAINRDLVASGIDVSELTPTHPSLEDVFLNLVREGGK
jgi:hypothetical protein